MNDTRTCAACFVPLPPDSPRYATLCRGCFVSAKKRELNDLRLENLLLRDELDRLRARSATAIDATMLRRLIQLAHPDRHNSSEASLIATRWLIEQRDAARRLAA
jgi:hypothetical protein